MFNYPCQKIALYGRGNACDVRQISLNISTTLFNNMNLDGMTRGDTLGSISDEFRDTPEPIATMIDELLKLSGESRREAVVYDALRFYEKALSKTKEGYVRIEIGIVAFRALSIISLLFPSMKFLLARIIFFSYNFSKSLTEHCNLEV